MKDRSNKLPSEGSLFEPTTIAAVGRWIRVSELEAAAERHAKRLSAKIPVGSGPATSEVDELLQAVMERLTGLLRAEAATVFMHDPQSHELWGRVMNRRSLKNIRITDTAGIAGHVFSTGATLLLGDAYTDARFNPEVDRQSGFRTRSVIAVPLQHRGAVLGVLQVLDRRVDFFTANDCALAEAICSQIAAVLDAILQVEELKDGQQLLQSRVSDLDALYETEKAISAATAQHDLLDRLLAISMEHLGAKSGSILVLEEDGGGLCFRAARGEKSEALAPIRLKSGRGIAGHVAQSLEVVRVKDAEDCQHYDRSVAKKLGLTTGAVLCVPIIDHSRTLGALQLLNKKGGFTAKDERLAVLLAGQIGRAMARLQSKEHSQKQGRLAAIGQMLSGVLHDLRNPLTVIGGYAEMMASEADPQKRAEMSSQILAQLGHISAMQNETLAFVRGEKSILAQTVSLVEFMGKVVEQLQSQFATSGVDLEVHVGYEGFARFDENKMKRVILNLSNNAIDAMPEGGRFTLSVDREGDELVFRAKDNGPGIPSEVAERLFESFVTSGKKHGTGLGLAIVKTIAEEHGGTVSCKTQLGKGASFEVRLPAGTPAD